MKHLHLLTIRNGPISGGQQSQQRGGRRKQSRVNDKEKSEGPEITHLGDTTIDLEKEEEEPVAPRSVMDEEAKESTTPRLIMDEEAKESTISRSVMDKETEELTTPWS
jgi:hypothetical protein